MKDFILVVLIVVIFNGCSSNEATKNEGGNSGVIQTNSNNNVAANQDQMLVPYNGIQNIDQNAFNAKSPNVKQNNGSVNPNQSLTERIAPDNSNVSVTMDKNGNAIQTRTFLNHQVLVKVEKIITAKDTKYKVYLKNGKVVEAPSDKMENFTALHPNNILAAIGLPPPTPRPEERVPEMQKPKQ